jgi:hypothetical protein
MTALRLACLCPVCGGTGVTEVRSLAYPAEPVRLVECPTCAGRGAVAVEPVAGAA